MNLWVHHIAATTVVIREPSEKSLEADIQQIFDHRNKALLEANIDVLGSLYERKGQKGIWAYEHELKKMEYFHQWANKQLATFTKVSSQVKVTNVQEKTEGYSISLAVATEYEYVYDDEPSSKNNFMIGTYHSLDLIPKEDDWVITREWYTDPFADSLDLDEHNSQEMQEIILSGQERDLSNLNERRRAAVKYADEYCGVARSPNYDFQYNTQYRNYNPLGGDCANFASQMLYEGGQFIKNPTWNYDKGGASKAWVNAHAFNNYVLYSGRASLIAAGTYEQILKNSYKLLPGDYIAYEKKGKVTHISVVAGADSKGYALVNSHNTDRYKVPWDLGWSNNGIKFWLVRVHY